MALTLAGIFSGMDTNSIIAQLMAINARPLNLLDARKKTEEAKQSAITDLQTRFTTLLDLADKLHQGASLRTSSVSSSDSDILTASGSGAASEGLHSVVVNQLATGQKRIHTVGVASLSTEIGDGRTFSYTYQGVTRTLTTAAGATLEGLRDLVNNDGANPGAAASILEYNGAYHLVLSARHTGADNTITINDAQTTLAGFASADIAETQAARNAQLRVDGFPPGAWIERDNNTVTDVITGVTLTLKSTGSANVSLARSTSELKSDLTNLASIYNGLRTKIGEYAGYDEKTKKGGVLQGDGQITSLLQSVRLALVATPAGFKDGEDPFALAGRIGISFAKDGTMSVDAAVFDAAASENYLGVLSLIGAQGTGVSDSASIQFVSATQNVRGGAYELSVDFDADGAVTTARIRGQGEEAWRWLNVSGNTLTGGEGSPEQDLVLSAMSDGTPGVHTQTALVRVRQGFAGAIYRYVDDLMDETTGRFTIRKAQITTRISQLTRSIELQTERLAREQIRMKAQFARLEQTLARMDMQRAALSAFGVSSSYSSSSGGLMSL